MSVERGFQASFSCQLSPLETVGRLVHDSLNWIQLTHLTKTIFLEKIHNILKLYYITELNEEEYDFYGFSNPQLTNIISFSYTKPESTGK